MGQAKKVQTFFPDQNQLDDSIYLLGMRSAFLACTLLAASFSHAAWKPLRDTPAGWSGTYSLVPSDTVNAPLTSQTFAIPFGASPRIQATLHGPDSSRQAVAYTRENYTWSGANMLQINLQLNPSQRALKNFPHRHVVLDVSWSSTASGSPLLPIVTNTIANPIGAARFGASTTVARKATTNLARLPSGPSLTVEIGDLTKRQDKVVSRTTDHGIFRLTGKDLKTLFGSLAGTSLRNISVYRSARDSLPLQPAGISSPTLQPVRVERISTNLDGSIQDADEIRFYVEGSSVWVRDSTIPCGNGWKLSVSPYALSRRYLVALQPDGDLQPLSPDLGPTHTSLLGAPKRPIQTWALEKHQMVTVSDNGEILGTNWHWLTTPIPAEGVLGPTLDGLRSDTGCVEVNVAPSSRGTGGTLLVNGDSAKLLRSMRLHYYWTTRSLKSAGTRLRLPGSSQDKLLGFSIHAAALPQLSSGQAEFPTPDTGSIAVPFRVPVALSDSMVGYAIADGQVLRRVPLKRNPTADTTGWDGWVLSDSTSTLAVRYRIGTVATMLTSSSSSASLKAWVAPSGSLAMTDFGRESGDSVLVIAPDEFSEIAQAYANYRSSLSPRRKMKTRFVRLEDIYVLYSGGAADPTAIRDFLRWARSSLGTSHVLLMGSAYYDMRDMLKSGVKTHVPIWETGSLATDNYYAYLDSSDYNTNYKTSKPTIDLQIGRIPARSPSEARAWLEKLKIYEAPAPGQDPSWRNTALLVADDFYISDSLKFQPDDAGNHAERTQNLSSKLHAKRPWLLTQCLYSAKYSFVENENGLRKPIMRLDLLSRLNQGTMLFNYIGHGAGEKLSHESIFQLSDINTLSNAASPFLFHAASCDVGQLDLGNIPLGSSLLLVPGKGAVATVSATRPTSDDDNSAFNRAFFEAVFDTLSGARSLGEALTMARNSTSRTALQGNQDAYILLGDPAMPLANVGLHVAIDSFPDTLQALYAFKKNVTVNSANPSSLAFRILGAPVLDTLRGLADHPITLNPTPVTQDPKQIISLATTIRNGQGTIIGITPAKLEFGKTSSISGFAIDQVTGACGGFYKGNILQSGTDTSAGNDAIGPTIRFSPCDSSYSAGEPFTGIAKVTLPFCLNVELEDSTGISSATGPDEGTIVNLPGIWDTYRPELRSGASFRQSSFQLNIDSTNFKTGTAHQLSVLTHDQMGNFTQGVLQIQVQKEDAVGLYDIFNRPNPVKSGASTTFYFKVTANPDTNNAIPSSLQASVRIHTLSGKLIRVLHTDLTQEKALRPKATWDLKDAFGNSLANGLYPYTVRLRVPGATSGSWEQFEKRGIVAISR